PRVAAPLALAGVIYWLADRKPQRVLLSHLDVDWRHELLGSFAHAKQRIVALTANAQANRTNAFYSKPLDPAAIAPDNPFAELLDADRNARSLALDRLTDFNLEVLKGRYVVSALHEGTQRLVLESVGYGLDPKARFWLERFVGSRLEDSADISYGRWIAEASREVLSTGRTRFDAVDVSIVWPSGELGRYQFQRALVPVELGRGRRGVLSATIKDPTVNLRAANVDLG
ncbi:MAG: hypothetical protein RL291_844, partial [Pseudomonadota bacterium]